MNWRKLAIACLSAAVPAFAGGAIAGSPSASSHGGWHGGWHGDMGHFHNHDMGHWQHGHWWHGGHGDRLGWWWIVGPTWYFYPAPIYPYPNPYVPPVIVQPQPNYWYYCNNPAGYYPYVADCLVPWQPVPAQPQ